MTTRESTTSQTRRPTGDSNTSRPDDRFDLVTAYQKVLEREERRSGAIAREPPPAPSPRGQAILAAVLSVFSLYLWIGQPAWMMPAPEPAPSPAEVDQGRSLGLELQAGVIEDHRRATGSLPASLDEVGRVMPGIDYQLTPGGGYVLSLPGSDRIVESDDTAQTILDILEPEGIAP